MPTMTITNDIKKNVIEVETWYHSEKDVYVKAETGWRFASYTIEIDEDFKIDVDNKDGFCVTDYPYEDMDATDSFSFDFSSAYSLEKELTDEEEEVILEDILNIFDEDGWYGLESAGWSHEDTETWIYGPLVIEEVNNDS